MKQRTLLCRPGTGLISVFSCIRVTTCVWCLWMIVPGCDRPQQEPGTPTGYDLLLDTTQSDNTRAAAALALNEQLCQQAFDAEKQQQLITAVQQFAGKESILWRGIQAQIKGDYYNYGSAANIDSAILYYEQARQHFSTGVYPAPLEKALTLLSYLYSIQNRWEEAQGAIAAADTCGDGSDILQKSIRAQTASQIAYSNGAYYQALLKIQESARYKERAHDFGGLGILYINAFSILDRAKMHEEGLEYVRKSVTYLQAYNQQISNKFCEVMIAMSGITLASSPDAARTAYQKARQLILDAQDSEDACHVENWMANYYRSAGELDSAAFYLRRSSAAYAQLGMTMFALSDRADLACVLLAKGDFASLQPQLPSLLAELVDNRQNGLLLELYEHLRLYYEKIGDIPSAYQYYRKRETLSYLVFGGKPQEESILEVHMKYIQEQEEIRMEAQQASERAAAAHQIKQQQWVLWASGAGLLMLTAMSFAFYRNYRIKKRAAKELEDANAILADKQNKLRIKNAQLQRFSGVISHDVLSNLDLIISAGNVLAGPQAKKESLQQYYSMIQQTSLQLKKYCLRLLEEVRKDGIHTGVLEDPMPALRSVLTRIGPALQQAGVDVDVQQLSPAPVPAAVTEQVFHNLLSNALRYGVHTRQHQPPRIGIREQQQDHQLCWIVEDNGPGIPDGAEEHIFDGTHPKGNHGQGQGIGLSLVRSTLRIYGADIYAENRAEGGARFTVCFHQM